MRAKQTILSRLLPKSNQSTVYRTGDDGTHQAGWWKRLTTTTNKNRFIAKTLDGDDVVIDRATGLMWAADGNAAGGNSGHTAVWNAAIDYANALDFAGFTDWRIPNVLEIYSLVNFGVTSPMVYTSFFTNIVAHYYWSSTTWPGGVTYAWSPQFETGVCVQSTKITARQLLCVRSRV